MKKITFFRKKEITRWYSSLSGFKGNLFLLAFVVLSTLTPFQIQAQTPGTVEDAFNLPNPDRCTSKDLEVVSASLDLDNCNCEDGTVSYYDLVLGIYNKTGSIRTSYAFWARLTSTDPVTNEETVYFVNGCQGPIASNSTTYLNFDGLNITTYNEVTGNFDPVNDPENPGELLHQIPYTCGEILELSNIYQGWTDASENDARQCPLNPSKINPKCGVTESVRIDVGLTAAAVSTNVSCYGEDDGSFTISFTGGTAPYYVKLDGGSYTLATSPKLFDNLAPDTYNWYVKDSNTPACELSGSVEIEEPDAVMLTTSSTNVSCNGANDGSLSIDSFSGTGTPTFYLKTGAGAFVEKTQAEIEAITAAGDYVIKVTYPNGNADGVCENTSSETIAEPDDVMLTTSSTNVSCNGANDGSLSIDSFSGTGTPTFYLKTGAGAFVEKTQAEIEAITAAGDYVIKVTYPNGNADGVCENTSSETIAEPDDVMLTTSSTNVSCNGTNDGSLSIDSFSGTGTPTFYLKTGAGAFVEKTQAEIEAVTAAGDYVIKVTYPNGNADGVCENTSSETIAEPDAVMLTTSSTNVSCNGANDGSLSIDSFSGTGTPTFYLKTGAGAFVEKTQAEIEAITAAGDYVIKVTYPNGNADGVCENTSSETIAEPDDVMLTTSSTNVSCNGTNDGSLSIDSFSGTGTPTFYLKTGAGAFVEKTQAEIEAVTAAGDYVIKVTYPNGNADGVCENTSSETIAEPDAVMLTTSSTNVSCNGANDGSLSIDSFSGTGTPTFYLKTGAGAFVEKTQAEIEAITAAGDYVIKVTYPNGNADGVCENTSSETIAEPDDVMLTTSSTNVSCNGTNDGSLSIDSFSGTGTPTFYLKTGAGAFVEKTQAEIEAVTAAGDYVIKVTYPNGNADGVCENTSSETIAEPDAVMLTTSSTNVSCNGANDGSLSIDSFSGTGTPTFYLKSGAGAFVEKTQAEIEAVTAAGDYVIKVTYPNGNADGVCENTSSETIAEPDDVMLTTSSTNVSCNGSNGSLSIDSFSGTGTPTFYLKTGAGAFVEKTQAEIEAVTAAGDYVIKVTYPNGNADGVCENTSSETIAEPDDVMLTTSSTNVSCNGANDGSLSIDSFSGTGTPTFYLKTGAGAFVEKTQAEIEAVTAAGDYVIKVTYPNGNADGVCENTSSETIAEPDAVMLTTSSTNVSCNGANDGSLSIDSFSGTGTPTFYLKTGAGAFVEKTQAEIEAVTAAGDYVIKVTYPNGNADGVCENTSSETIAEPDAVMLTTSSTNVSCNGSNGSLSIDSFSGTGTPTFYLKTGAGAFVEKTQAEIEAVTAAGDYVIKVTYPNGNADGVCENTSSETIAEPDDVMLTTSSTNVSCNGANDGSLSIDSFSGTGTPTFYLKTGAGAFVEKTQAEIEAVTAAGDYVIKVTYPNGNADGVCENTSSETIAEPDAVMLTTSSTNVSCNGANDGSLSIDSFSGTGTPTFYLKSGAGAFVEKTQAEIEAITAAGDYVIKVTYPNGNADGVCENTSSETIVEPGIILTPDTQPNRATCIADAQGSVALSYDPLLGITQFYYSYKLKTEGSYSAYAEYLGPVPLGPGMYDFKVVYALDGCESLPFDVEIQRLPAVDFPLSVDVVPVDCDSGNGNIKISLESGLDTGFFTYKITSGGVEYFNEKQTETGFDLPPGTYVIFGISDNNCDSGRTEVTLDEPICEEFEGCTLGYWKNHTDRWACYDTCTPYIEVFSNASGTVLAEKSLLEVLNLGGGGIYNLGRQSVAALLNTCHGDVNYEIGSTEALIAYVNASLKNNPGEAGSILDAFNNAGCTLGGTRATTAPSDSCPAEEASKPGKGKPGNKSALTSGFKASPVPFKDKLSIQYDFDYVSDVNIQVYDLSGQLLKTYKDKKVTKGDVKDLGIDFRMKANQIYILRVQTNREVFTQNIISAKR